MDVITYPENMVFGLDIGTRSIVGTVGYKQNEHDFIIASQSVRYHETRAMLDGQIHDINKVAETIREVKRDLEKQLGRKLKEVCIAAAGRVLKTVTVKAEYNLINEGIISEEHIRTLELNGVEKAYEELRKEMNSEEGNFYCVGYSVVRYYLNDYVMTNLEDHKGNKIGVELLATFLPEEVIEGLYAAVEKAGLEVVNLTLEPIAAINVAIPEKFRLLNIALIDVGAGTSDICITKDGSIIAYGMIPKAGDALTNTLMQRYLVDFKTAESMKTSVLKKKTVSYKDIMGLSNKVTREEIYEAISVEIDQITAQIAEQILYLNGGKSVSAVFVVGGGGKLPYFVEALSSKLNLPKERVALRGEEVLNMVQFLQKEIKKDPLLVTPIGICLNYYENRNNFIYVMVNGERIKLYDNTHLTIVDAALTIGFPNELLFPRRGRALHYTLNGSERLARGEAGEGAIIILNGKQVSLNASITQNDIIQITESTAGADATLMVAKLPEYKSTITFAVNHKEVLCPKYVLANGILVSDTYQIKDGDRLELLNHYTLEQLLEFMDLPYRKGITINHQSAKPQDRVYENFTIYYPLHEDITTSYEEVAAMVSEEEFKEYSIGEDALLEEGFLEDGSSPAHKEEVDDKKVEKGSEITVYVNGTLITLKGKDKFILVDILDVYPFDLTIARGSRVVLKINGNEADFTNPLNTQDVIEMYWEK
ncbi:MAG TPA: cell division protein FtsA [Lachnoclostridium phytofermentans]|uniref:Cell division protein FtsA n=1 Tax=Lachnoclostridium phytofermentans TaxID=66219 RepID=A0A3D2X690_9FIRM|nr:cell division FtsA domain-containing protein [Lachnoclostridium sp.]HCL02075.1 cell division protein FtsA [Lachnoclostridium phytofermentans]